jgi:hypothetical protein
VNNARAFPFLSSGAKRSGVEGPDELSRDHDYWVYMMSNKKRTVLYTGVTNDLHL